MTSPDIIAATRRLAEECRAMTFARPTHVYNPLEYAWLPHSAYLKKYAQGKKKTLFLGMNPGPWGMAQTGIPFGDTDLVRDWLGIEEAVDAPAHQHPKRLIRGFQCPRPEVSGRRLWGLFRRCYPAAEDFFANHFVANYCPLLFVQGLDNRVINITPDKLPKDEAQPLYAACDRLLRTLVTQMEITTLIGVGNFAAQRLRHCFADIPAITIGQILHPSPANPHANRGFDETAIRQLSAFSPHWLSLFNQEK